MKNASVLKFGILLVSFLFQINGFALDYTQWNLPEGAVARLGKGKIIDIAYSPDGTKLAVASSIGIWIYDAYSGAEVNLNPANLNGCFERCLQLRWTHDC